MLFLHKKYFTFLSMSLLPHLIIILVFSLSCISVLAAFFIKSFFRVYSASIKKVLTAICLISGKGKILSGSQAFYEGITIEKSLKKVFYNTGDFFDFLKNMKTNTRWTGLFIIDGKKESVSITIITLPLRMSLLTIQKSDEEFGLDKAKNEALKSLSAGVAHNFNNLLMKIMSTAELIAVKNKSNVDLLLYISKIKGFALQASKFSDSLLTFSAPVTAVNLEKINIEEILAGIISSYITEHPNASFNFKSEHHLSSVTGDVRQIEEMFQNLIQNAVEACNMNEKSIKVDILIKPISSESDLKIIEKYSLNGNPFIQIEISDSGPGFPPEPSSRLFDPYFSTKGFGRGLGLSLAFGVCRGMGGKIFLENHASGGRVLIFMPIAEE